MHSSDLNHLNRHSRVTHSRVAYEPPLPEDRRHDDAQLWERFKTGDKAALTHIYKTYADVLFNYGCQFTACHELIKDAIQDLFIDLINHQESLGGTNSIKYYLFKCLRNRLVRTLTKSSKFCEATIEQQAQFTISVTPELILINRQIDEQKRNLIRKKLNDLPPLQREALLLFYYEGLSYDQISNILGIKVKSARALIYRSLHTMGKLIAPHKTGLQE